MEKELKVARELSVLSCYKVAVIFVFMLTAIFANAQSYIQTKTFDDNGVVSEEAKTFYDNLGREIQSQKKVISDNSVLAIQTIYDDYGRKVLETLPAPTNQSLLSYKDKFITNPFSGENYSANDFDRKEITVFTGGDAWTNFWMTIIFGRFGMVDYPWPLISNDVGSLGYYYSDNNVQEPYAPASQFPYSRVEFDDENLIGSIKRSSSEGVDLKMGSKHELQSYSMLTLNDLDYLYGKGKSWIVEDYEDINFDGNGTITPNDILSNRVIKNITVDENGQERVAFIVGEEIVATCLSGQVNNVNENTKWLNYEEAGISSLSKDLVTDTKSESAFIDIHLAKGCESSLTIANKFGHNPSNPATYKILDLKTGKYVKFANNSIEFSGTQPNLEAGFYRILWVRGGVYRRDMHIPAFRRGVTLFSFKVSHTINYHNFEINYLDKAGRKKLWVSPEGVDNDYIPQTGTVPNHKMINSNLYVNSLGDTKVSVSPDEGFAYYIYRHDGKVRFSMNAKQHASNPQITLSKYSYINYDELGRIIETGEYDPLVSANPISFHANNVDVVLDEQACSQQNYILYDVPDDLLLNSIYKQEYLLGKVSKTWNENSEMFYSYDELGRVAWTLEIIDNTVLSTINYSYDLNGNVTQVAFQKDDPNEDFYYTYKYDRDKRLKQVFTSVDAGVSKDKQAEYFYYKHGPLKRIELANNTQGIDYVYTINGWLKSINTPELNERDPGKDGYRNSSHAAKDLFGMSLDYFKGDYKRANTFIQTAERGKDLFNGIVKSQRWQTKMPLDQSLSSNIENKNSQLYYGYDYDNKYQLSAATFSPIFNNGNLNGTAAGSGSGPLLAATSNNYADYKIPEVTYDLNGNILSLNRNGYTNHPDGISMDELTYNYDYSLNGDLLSNKLKSVEDNVEDNNYGSHEFDPGDNNGVNYSYNEIGQQIADDNTNSSNQTSYNVYGKVTEIQYPNYTVGFGYDTKGFRVRKTVGNVTTWYLRDSKGKLISQYEKIGSGPILQKSINLIADNRIGVYYPVAEKYLYELTDHLGNVRSTFSNIEIPAASTSFDGNGELDYVFESHPNSNIDNQFDRSSSSDIASIIVNEASFSSVISGIKVKTGDVVSGSIYLNGAADNTDSKLYIVLIDEAPISWWSILDIASQPIITSNIGGWEKNLYAYTVPTDGEFLLVIYNPTGKGKLRYDDFTINFSDGGILYPNTESITDYYPHGSPLPGREIVSTSDYNYGYQGQNSEKDKETNLNSFELRNYNPLLGRWNSIDPYKQYNSPYMAMGNNPINVFDFDGGYGHEAQSNVNGGNTAAYAASFSNYSYSTTSNNYYVYSPDGAASSFSSSSQTSTYSTTYYSLNYNSNSSSIESTYFTQAYSYTSGYTMDANGTVSDPFFTSTFSMYQSSYSVPLNSLEIPLILPQVGTGDIDGNGKLSLSEANTHYNGNTGQTLEMNLANLDLSSITPADFPKGVGSTEYINLLFRGNASDGLVYGTFGLEYLGGTRVQSTFDRYDFDIRPWSFGDNYIRNIETVFGSWWAGEGTPFRINLNGEGVISPNPSTQPWPDWENHGYCFIAGTNILMSDGTTKKIEDIVIGDHVLTYNLNNEKAEVNKVLKIDNPVHIKLVDILFDNGVVNTNTPDHPYFVKGKGWSSVDPELTKKNYKFNVGEMVEGDTCLLYDNKNKKVIEVNVSSILNKIDKVQTFNLSEVANNSNYFANSILVHNKLIPAKMELKKNLNKKKDTNDK